MVFSKKINTATKTDDNTGFGANSADYGGRFINKAGNANISTRGISFLRRISWYHTLLAMPTWKFASVILLAFLTMNLFFAGIYYVIGIEHLGGLIHKSSIETFGEVFFFSCQTFTTVGYGRINPIGFLASAIASFEALTGLLSFALATGLFFGRFAKPKAFLKFSENIVIAPYKNGAALMFRLAPYKNTVLTDAEAKLTLAIGIEENGKMVNRFYPLPLEFSLVNSLTLSWTIVHPITAESPLAKFTEEDFKTMRGEFLVFIKAFDDMFSNVVVARTSYIFEEVVYGAKFSPMFHRDGKQTILEIDKLDNFVRINLPVSNTDEN